MYYTNKRVTEQVEQLTALKSGDAFLVKLKDMSSAKPAEVLCSNKKCTTFMMDLSVDVDYGILTGMGFYYNGGYDDMPEFTTPDGEKLVCRDNQIFKANMVTKSKFEAAEVEVGDLIEVRVEELNLMGDDAVDWLDYKVIATGPNYIVLIDSTGDVIKFQKGGTTYTTETTFYSAETLGCKNEE